LNVSYALSSQENNQSIWELLTFKFVNPMMDIGITRQLDFTDLLELPVELRAASSYEKLLSSWTVEHQHHHADSSLLRAMSNAYGWTYFRLGLLKVLLFPYYRAGWHSKCMLLDMH
jgi:ATP-binding cassette subfamily C (CFTR/MRP) protein 10